MSESDFAFLDAFKKRLFDKFDEIFPGLDEKFKEKAGDNLILVGVEQLQEVDKVLEQLTAE